MLQNFIGRVRRNHGLEHATIHLLSQKYRGFGAQGNSTHRGFHLNLYGPIAEADVQTAVHEALQRMKEGETHLALHPNCGTVLLTTATMTTLVGQGVFAAKQRQLKRSRLDTTAFIYALPSAILAVVLTLVASRPLGMYFQSYTTTGQMGQMRIKQIRRQDPSPLTHFFRVLLGRNKRIQTTSYFIETEG